MQISNNTVVSFHYTVLNEAGEEVETSRGEDPSLCLIGANNTLAGVEQAMIGKQAGDSFKVSLEPHLAYGLYSEKNKDRISAKYLKHEGKLKVGKVVRLNTNQGYKTGTILKVGKFNVDIDLNHPLAGQAVSFDIEIMAVRDGTAEEIAHGHAHGIGGHNH
ncbi:FKBP-type peptidyl-prolyl cis-trans isomerase [Oceanicoccus sagamiensis]|uniref:Peptidyl-prolyl cis-trans isomerase n=1 Tax=Oceanicoccus sagamiensis TaxID=716816 RepID=A0A1X9NCE1_9GAMM|nr:peptidylprolyl isomerase [Oceanicoccus sagamiensis]ARN73565.1 peptidylprolyl isomerase [Oceanicoccus sagamiensis]